MNYLCRRFLFLNFLNISSNQPDLWYVLVQCITLSYQRLKSLKCLTISAYHRWSQKHHNPIYDMSKPCMRSVVCWNWPSWIWQSVIRRPPIEALFFSPYLVLLTKFSCREVDKHQSAIKTMAVKNCQKVDTGGGWGGLVWNWFHVPYRAKQKSEASKWHQLLGWHPG